MMPTSTVPRQIKRKDGSTKLRWARPEGPYHSSKCGRFTIYCYSRDRKAPLWKIFENGVGVRDLACSFEEAKDVAQQWADGTRKRYLT